MAFTTRLTLARDAGLDLPDGPFGVWAADIDTAFKLNDAQIISSDARVHNAVPTAAAKPSRSLAAAAVCIPREKTRARALLAEAAAATTGPLIVDGQKTDGIDPHLKALKARAEVTGLLSKAHGKMFWMHNAPDLSDWAAQPALVDGFTTLPGVFSSNHVDPGSKLLAQALPETLGASVADLGAGWGWLAAQIVRPTRVVHMVECDAWALDCARKNVPSATAHWADVNTWQAPMYVDAVVMNPPFHQGRRGTPDLGKAFIAKAADILKPKGQLFMVANRHLPYEATLAEHFATYSELPGDGRYKIFCATAPTRARKRR